MKYYRNKKEFIEMLPGLEAVEIYEEVLSGRYIDRFPRGFWKQPEAKQNAAKVTKYMIKKELKWSDEDLKDKLTLSTFISNRLNGMMCGLFNNSAYKAIDNAYPDKFKEWEFNKTPRNYWNKETAKKATKWLIEEKLEWSDEDVKEKLDGKVLIDNKLRGMSSKLFDDSLYKVIENAYPGKFKEWEFKYVQNKYWNEQTAKKATKWLIEEKLEWSDEDVKTKLNQYIFNINGLRGMTKIFNNSPYNVINNAYPGKFKEWEFNYVPKGYWNKETAKEATIWMIEENLKWSFEDIKNKLTIRTFMDNGLKGMLHVMFGDSRYKAMNNAYPGKFKQSDFKNKDYYFK